MKRLAIVAVLLIPATALAKFTQQQAAAKKQDAADAANECQPKQLEASQQHNKAIDRYQAATVYYFTNFCTFTPQQKQTVEKLLSDAEKRLNDGNKDFSDGDGHQETADKNWNLGSDAYARGDYTSAYLDYAVAESQWDAASEKYNDARVAYQDAWSYSESALVVMGY